MSDAVTLVGNSRPWGGQVTGDCGPYTCAQWWEVFAAAFDGSGNRGPLLDASGLYFQVTESGPAAMTVDVAAGEAIVNGCWARDTTGQTLNVAANATGMTRYDLVFLYLDIVAQVVQVRIVDGIATDCCVGGAGVVNCIEHYQNAGVEWAVPLACVAVPNGAASIVNANITDLREFCRYRTSPEDLVDGVMLTTDPSTHLIEIAAGGVGVTEIAAAIAGAGLVGGAGAALDVNPDGVTLEINADAVRIAATAAGNGLGGGGGAALSVNVDASTIVIVGDTLEVGTGLDNTNIANRTRTQFIGANQLYASVANPPTWGAIGAQPVPAEGWICATAVDDYVIGHWHTPVGFVAGNVTVYIIWSHVAAANQVCRWRLDYIDAMGCGGDLTGGTTSITQDVNANLADADLRMCTQLTTTIAMNPDEYLDFFVGRNGAHGNDTLAVSATLLGVLFSYTADM